MAHTTGLGHEYAALTQKGKIMRDTEITQNWMSVVGFKGKKEKGFQCAGKENVVSIITDYVELRINPREGSSLYSLLDYTKEDWLKEHTGAIPFIERDGKFHGDYKANGSCYTMAESIDEIIAYVHFNHYGHEFNTIFFEVGNIVSRELCDLAVIKSLLKPGELDEIIQFAKVALRKDFEKEEESAQWMYSEYAKENGVVDIEENTKRKW